MELTKDNRVLIVGASLACLRVCEGLRKDGFEGEIVVVGGENHLPYDRPPLSKEFLAGKVDASRISLRAPEKINALDVEFRLGVRAVGLSVADHFVFLADGQSISFDRLVIATGATPRTLPMDTHHEGVLTLRTIEDAVMLRELITTSANRVVVVGGGFLGMEVAATAKMCGAEVTVVEPLETPLGRVVGNLVGNALAQEHREHEVNVLTGVGVVAIHGSARVEKVELSDGHFLDADVVVVAVGVVPETAWLDGSGLVIDNGIVCDASLCAAPQIYGAGDVARWPLDLAGGLVRIEHWTNAAEQGAHVASVLVDPLSEKREFRPVPYFWSDHYDLKIQALGLPGPNDEVVIVDGSLESRRFVACYGRSEKIVGAIAFGRPRQLMAFRSAMNAQMAFRESLELLKDK